MRKKRLRKVKKLIKKTIMIPKKKEINPSIGHQIFLSKNRQKKITPYIKKIVDIFEKENIEYSVCFGSLLGCIRHQGFIPWDDDFDILVSNKDRRKALVLLKKNKLQFIRRHGKFFDNYMIKINNLGVLDLFFSQKIDLKEHKIFKNRIDNTYKYIFSNEKLPFEDFTVKVPSNYKEVLDEYYGDDWQTKVYFTNHRLINFYYRKIRVKHGGNAFNLSYKNKYKSFNIDLLNTIMPNKLDDIIDNKISQQVIVRGQNSLIQIKDIIENKKIFIVSGKNSFIKSGAKITIDSITNNYFWFSEFTPNPTIDQIQDGYCKFIDSNYDIIVAIGGGSSIDVAKAIKLEHHKQYQKNTPIIACPTTAGSGSESTYFIVYYKDKEKQSEGKPEITLPEYVILDHSLVKGLPQKVFASSVLDALSQSIESYWSIYSTQKSKNLAKLAMDIIKDHGLNSVLDRDDFSCEIVMSAANLAGQAINITKTTACHSLAYPITSYFGIDHGHACSLTLSQILKYNYEVDRETINDDRGIDYVKKSIEEILLTFGCKNTEEFDLWLKLFITKLGLKYTFEDLGVDKSIIIKHGFNPDRVKNNPRLLTKENLDKIL